MRNSSIIEYKSYGEPEEVLKISSENIAEPKNDQVLVKLLASPIHPSDFGMIGGSYGKLKTLPAVGGREAVGEIIAAGSCVKTLKPKMWVKIPENLGVWREFCLCKESELFIVPNDLPKEMAAMAFINPPTAWNLLHLFVRLKSGDFVIQNASNSAVGYLVIQIAKKLGIKTINVVRNQEYEADLKAIGADFVFTEEFLNNNRIDKIIGEKPKLALNSIGGQSAINLIKNLADGGTMVTFGGMSSESIRFPTRYLIFNNIQLKGFWMDKWIKTNPKEYALLMEKIFNLIREKTISIPIQAIFPITKFLEAIKEAKTTNRKGKVLITA